MKLPRVLALQLFTYRAPACDAVAHDGKTRHRGQALLLAVLLMLFAALLGATFVTVVAFNLSQTARNESRKSAEAAAQAGVRVANDQLVNSVQGENWRPEMISPPPAPGTAEFNTYYTPFERAQGWVRTAPPWNPAGDENLNGIAGEDADHWQYLENEKVNNNHRIFAKFPDPRLLTAGGKDTPTYLMEVTPQSNGLLRVDVIGRSDDNDATFFRQVVYKGTSWGGGPLSFPVYVANYDTQKNALRVTTMTGGVTTSPSPMGTVSSLPVRDPSLFFPGQTVIIAAGNAPGSSRDWAVIHRISGNNLILNRALTSPGAFGNNSEVRAAGILMNNLLGQSEPNVTSTSAAALDGDGDRATGPASYATQLFDPLESTNGLYVGAGLLLDGKIRVDLDMLADDRISVSGPVRKTARAIARINGDTAADDFPDSTVTNRTGVAAKVADGPNSEDGVPVLVPPSLAGTDGKYTRYLSLTRDADRNAGSQYGYGPGVYIDNADDIEKVRVERDLDTTPGNETITYRVLDNWEMHRLWQRKSFPERSGESGNVDNDGTDVATGYTSGTGNDAHRLAWKRSNDSYSFPVTGSLEQSGIRGWVSPWEYLPRGVLIEFNDDKIVITRDERSDGGGTVDSTKGWRYDENGALLSSLNRGENIFRMEIDTDDNRRTIGLGTSAYSYIPAEPFNGVIFAEGNVRVRGMSGDKDVTIVSKGNIYIEGNIRRKSATAGRIALLAKRNVVVNPTQFVARPEGMRVLSTLGSDTSTQSGTAQGTDEIAGINVNEFRVGDLVQLSDSGNWVQVQRVVRPALPAQPYIELTSPHGLTGAVQVRRLSDPALQEISNGYQFVMPNSNIAFIRDIRREGVALGNKSLTWQHNASVSTSAFNLKNTSATAQTYSVKPHANTDTTVSAAQQVFKPGTLLYDLLDVGGDGTAGGDAVETLDALRQRFNRPDVTSPVNTPPTNVDPDLNWEMEYTGYVEPGSATSTNAMPYGTIAARRLASINWLEDPSINIPAGAGGEGIFTVSMGLFWRPMLDTLGGLSATTTGPDNWLIGSAFNAGDPDDAVTVRRSFYGGAPIRSTYGAFTPSNTANGSNFFAVRHYLGSNYFGSFLPTYYMSMPKLEGTSITDPPLDIQIEATILAEEGSWLVIPAPMNQPQGTPADSTRYRRNNYRIHVVGTVAQGYTPTGVEDLDNEVAPDAEQDTISPTTPYIGRGAMAQWIDSNARPTTVSGGTGDDWLSVTYEPDPLNVGEGRGLYLPVSPGWTYLG